VDIRTDPFFVEIAANQIMHEEWEDLISEDETEKNNKIGETFSQPARRRRPSNQIAEKKTT
jgi:hypothetical protein